jgi:hypothetical protein
MRQRRKWVDNLGIFGIGVFVVVMAFPAVIYVHENASQWEPLAIFVSFGLGLMPAIWYFRARRYGWWVGILSGVLLTFSFGSALAHGWRTQALALVNVGMAVGVVVMFVLMYRIRRNVESAMRDLGQALNGDALFRSDLIFRDDGERIVVYPNRGLLLLYSAAQALFLAIMGAVLAFVPIDNIWIRCGLGFLAVLMGLVFLATLSRVVVRRPTLVVGPDGILDHGSLIATGMGLIRWDEILGVRPNFSSAGGVKQRYLSILVTDAPAIRKRQPPWKRIASRTIVSSPLSMFDISQRLLTVPAEDLAEQIKRYVETHAPPDFFADEQDDEEPAPPPVP